MSVSRLLPALLAVGLTAAPAWALDLQGQVTVNGKPAPDVVVYVEGVTGGPAQGGSMMQQGMSFRPGVVVVRKGQPVAFPNQDPVFHSVFSKGGANPFDIGLFMKGPGKAVTMANTGHDEVQCHIHKQMKAHVLTLDHGYFTKTDAQGRFAIKGVPGGASKVTAWAAPGKTQSKPAAAGPLSFSL